MFKCAICGREFDDKELNEIKLLNKQANNMEIHQVCSTCFTNKEDMIGYISDKKNISFSSARQIYDYFSPFLGEISSELLRTYMDTRVKNLRSKLADNISAKEDMQPIDTDKKKKKSSMAMLKQSLIATAGVASVSVFILFCIIAGISQTVAAASVILGLIVAVALFVALYFVIDSFIKTQEDKEKYVKRIEELLNGGEVSDKTKDNKGDGGRDGAVKK